MSAPDSELDALGPVAEAFLARYRRGERPSLTEYTEKHPELAEQIHDVFPALMVMEELGAVEGAGTGFAPAAGPVRGKVPERLGDYRILREVGRGGMGIVYEAVQESLGRHVALKVLPLHGLLSPTHLERFQREARAAARLHHSNVVPVHGIGEHEGFHYYAMEFIQGKGLDEVLKEVRRLRDNKAASSAESARVNESGSLTQRPQSMQSAAVCASDTAPVSSRPPVISASVSSETRFALTIQPEPQYFRSVAQMGVQVAEALDYAHKQGVLHRDIKPSNLLLDTRGTVWVADFGLAKAEDTDEITHTGDIVGTLRYMAPERLNGLSDPRSDVYGLGITLYELLTLHPAYEESNRGRLIERIAHDDPPRPRKIDRSIPRDLETIVHKAIAKEPARRYQTAGELAGDLGRFLAGEPVRARQAGVWERSSKWAKRRPAVAALLAVSIAAVFFLIAGILVHNAQLEVALEEARSNLEKAKRAEAQAQHAEQEKTRQLAIAHLREAQARRNSGLAGRRFGSLEALKKAAELFHTIGQLDEERTLELRNEAIACFALADITPGKTWTPDPGWSEPLAFDPGGQAYAVRAAWEGPRGNGQFAQGQLSIRRIADDQEIACLPGFGSRVVAARFSPDGRYLAAHYDQGQRWNYIWEVSRREPILKVAADGYESFPAFSPDCRRAALARSDGSIAIYELPSGTAWKDLPPGPQVQLVQFHPDGRRLAVIGGSLVRLRDVFDGKELATFKHPAAIRTLTWRRDGNVLACGGYDHHIYLWDAANPAQPLRIIKGHSSAVVSMAFSYSGSLLLTESWDSTARLWDPATGQQLVKTSGGSVAEHQFAPDDRWLDYGWHLSTGRECRTYHGGRRLAWAAISPEGRLAASVSESGVQVWDLAATREADKLLATLPVGSSMAVHFDPMSEGLITDSKSAGLQRWPITPDMETGGLQIGPPRSLLLSPRAPVCGNDPQFALSEDGTSVAHSLRPGEVFVFDREDPRRGLLIQSPNLRHATFSLDARWLATGNWQGRGVKVWDARSGKLEKEFDVGGGEERAAWARFSPDGKWLVTGTFTEYAVWEAGTWRKRYSLAREHAAQSQGWVVFSPDGKMMAILHGVTEVRLMEPASGREFARLPAGGCPYCFSPDGSQLLTHAGIDGAFQVWDLRRARRQLEDLALDWDLPAYPPAPSETAAPFHAKVLLADPLPPSKELDAQAWFERGSFFVQMRQYQKAGADIKRARELDAKRVPLDEVLRAYTQAIEQHPQDAWAYHNRAHVHEWLKQSDKAIADFSLAIQHDPKSVEHYLCRARRYLRTDQKDKASADLRKAGEENAPEANRLAWRMVASPKSDRLEATLAVELAELLVRRGPHEPAYWNTLGVAHYRAGEWEAAIKALAEAEKLAAGKNFGFSALFMAMCHHQLGDAAKATDHYDRAVRWCQEHQGKLPADSQRELKAFRAEAETLLKALPPTN